MSQTENIRVSIIDADSSVSTVRVDGIVDTITSKEVERAIEGLIGRDQHRIVMDLAGVDYISSAGWGVFISHLKEAREHSGDLRLSGMIPNVREIFELLEFDTILNSFESASQATRSFEVDMPDLEGGPKVPAQTSNGGLDELAAIGVDAPKEQGGDSRSSRFESTSSQVGASTVGQAQSEFSGAKFSQSKSSTAAQTSAKTPNEKLVVLIVEDPFATIGELSFALQETRGSSSFDSTGIDSERANVNFGWWWVFRALWKEGLLSKRSRFKLSRRQNQRRSSS